MASANHLVGFVRSEIGQGRRPTYLAIELIHVPDAGFCLVGQGLLGNLEFRCALPGD